MTSIDRRDPRQRVRARTCAGATAKTAAIRQIEARTRMRTETAAIRQIEARTRMRTACCCGPFWRGRPTWRVQAASGRKIEAVWIRWGQSTRPDRRPGRRCRPFADARPHPPPCRCHGPRPFACQKDQSQPPDPTRRRWCASAHRTSGIAKGGIRRSAPAAPSSGPRRGGSSAVVTEDLTQAARPMASPCSRAPAPATATSLPPDRPKRSPLRATQRSAGAGC